jgi:hypothetical protein
MNAERHEQVKHIFLAACDLQPTEIAAFLNRVCAGDAELRQEVQSLLANHPSETIIGAALTKNHPARLRRPVPSHVAGVDSTGPPPQERFSPGTILAGRFRVIAPLGRGGMGTVYRADDLKLDQAVALKFLSRGRDEDPMWLHRYRTEVRLARKVSHPNVTRVYDISEAEGEVFIAMEYIDGEDLAALLRRVGRLAGDKVIQVARQLCAGLGAVHDKGVLHRDLKPANIMIDGCGQVRITDFGIAALSGQMKESDVLAGTPAFMAPELFEGAAPSIRSDLYSLGAILYELTTGKEPATDAVVGLRAPDTALIQLSAIVPEVDAALERATLQCLEHDPRRRPESAYAVAALLPGGDPLTSALAAGETPSPSMVAAAAGQGKWEPWAAVGCLGVALLALFLVVRLADQTFFLPQAGLEKSPAVLADKAEQIIKVLGRESDGQEHWQGFAIDRGYLQAAVAKEPRPRTWENLAGDRPPAVCFWYRAGGDQIALPALLGNPLPARVFALQQGMVTVRLDGRGSLLEYSVSTDRSARFEAKAQPPDWPALFRLAGLSMEQFKPMIRPVSVPPMYADSLRAWEGAYPENPAMAIRVEGASLDNRTVYFKVTPPWEQDWTDAEQGPSRVPRRMSIVNSALYLLAIIGGALLAWRNIRLGRSDQPGAYKLLAVIMFLGLLDWLLGERHVAVCAEEIALFYLWLARATLTAAIACVSYFAVEPYVRSRWPQMMITWSRLLRRKIRDPLVGRDILLGGMCGILTALVTQLGSLLPGWLGLPSPLPILPSPIQELGAVLGLRYKLNILIASLMSSITLALALLLLMLVLRMVLRRPWLASIVSWLLLTSLLTATSGSSVFHLWVISSIAAAISIALLVRAGIVALMVGLFFWSLIVNSPMTSNLSAWYAPSSVFAVLLAAALLIYGFSVARTRPLIPWRRVLDD